MLRKSRYTFLIEREGIFLVYNSARNNFLKVSSGVYNFIKDIRTDNPTSLDGKEKELLEKLIQLDIISTEEDDMNTLEYLKMKYLISSYSKETLTLTIAPTVSCNLRCPYCFEKSKPADIMTSETCNQVVRFVKSHQYAKDIRITWFGGEPLLCLDQITYMLERFSEESIPIKYQDIVTNGVLLHGQNLDFFEKYDIKRVQVTFDGTQENHDKKRIRPDGTGTYHEIMDNIDNFILRYPNIAVSIRVNIDKSNSDDYFAIRRRFKEKYPDKRNISIYPGILKDCGSAERNPIFFCNSDLTRLYERFRAEGIATPFPSHRYWGCGATRLSNYVVRPRGELYKCWQDIGIKERETGSVYSNPFLNVPLHNKYMFHGSHMMAQECLECPILPICDNNCANDRLENYYKGGNHELCSAYKDNDYKALKDKLYFIYINQNRREQK